MYAIASSVRPGAAMYRISKLVADATRAVLLLFSGPEPSCDTGRRESPKLPQAVLADDLGEDNQLI